MGDSKLPLAQPIVDGVLAGELKVADDGDDDDDDDVNDADDDDGDGERVEGMRRDSTPADCTRRGRNEGGFSCCSLQWCS